MHRVTFYAQNCDPTIFFTFDEAMIKFNLANDLWQLAESALSENNYICTEEIDKKYQAAFEIFNQILPLLDVLLQKWNVLPNKFYSQLFQVLTSIADAFFYKAEFDSHIMVNNKITQTFQIAINLYNKLILLPPLAILKLTQNKILDSQLPHMSENLFNILFRCAIAKTYTLTCESLAQDFNYVSKIFLKKIEKLRLETISATEKNIKLDKIFNYLLFLRKIKLGDNDFSFKEHLQFLYAKKICISFLPISKLTMLFSFSTKKLQPLITSLYEFMEYIKPSSTFLQKIKWEEIKLVLQKNSCYSDFLNQKKDQLSFAFFKTNLSKSPVPAALTPNKLIPEIMPLMGSNPTALEIEQAMDEDILKWAESLLSSEDYFQYMEAEENAQNENPEILSQFLSM